MRPVNPRDVALGLLTLAFSAFGLWQVQSLPVGTAVEMQAGYFPRLIFWLLAALGLACLARGIAGRASVAPDPLRADWIRPVIGVIASVAGFAVAVRPLGLVPAAALLCLIGGFGSAESRAVEVILLALGLALVSTLIFVVGLGLPIPLWPHQ